MVTFKFDLDGDNPEDIATVMVSSLRLSLSVGVCPRVSRPSDMPSVIKLQIRPELAGHHSVPSYNLYLLCAGA